VEESVKSLPAGMAEEAVQKGSKDSTRQRETLTVTKRKALSNLRTNTDHAIILADKGGAKVVLDTVDYNQKICIHLQDPHHIILAKGSTQTIERKTTLVRVLLNKSTLVKKVCIRLDPASKRPSRLYGFPKIRKERISLRPIVNNTGAPTYQLSEYLAGTLSPFVRRSMNNVRNSVESVRNQTYSVRSACKETARYAVPRKFLEWQPRYRIIVLCCK